MPQVWTRLSCKSVNKTTHWLSALVAKMIMMIITEVELSTTGTRELIRERACPHQEKRQG